jgi:hypothetical protein
MLETKSETTDRMGKNISVSQAAVTGLKEEVEYLDRTYKESEESLRELIRNR